MLNLELSSPVFSILSSFIEEKVGITYGQRDLDLLRDKASSRAIEKGFDSLLDYYYFLKYDPEGSHELAELVETLVVNETYFFREWAAIETLVNSFIAPWCSTGRRPRIWSAACATGEEPLSLAMLLASRDLLDKVEIVASDISARVLAKAKSGKFGRRSLRQVPDQNLVDRFLTKDEDGYVVDPRILSAVTWHQKNLVNYDDVKELGVFDIILCRNVLIYFSDYTVRTVLDVLSRSLVPDGALFVGVSESLLRHGGTFNGEERSGSFVYRRVIRQP